MWRYIFDNLIDIFTNILNSHSEGSGLNPQSHIMMECVLVTSMSIVFYLQTEAFTFVRLPPGLELMLDCSTICQLSSS
jgi:hypothetical protein